MFVFTYHYPCPNCKIIMTPAPHHEDVGYFNCQSCNLEYDNLLQKIRYQHSSFIRGQSYQDCCRIFDLRAFL